MSILTPSFIVGMVAGAFLMALGTWVGALAERIRGTRRITIARSFEDRDVPQVPSRAKRTPPRRPMASVRPKRSAPPPRPRDDVRDWLMQMGYPEEVASDVSDKVASIVPATAPLPDRIREAMHHLPQEN
jgi:hypothetical protein